MEWQYQIVSELLTSEWAGLSKVKEMVPWKTVTYSMYSLTSQNRRPTEAVKTNINEFDFPKMLDFTDFIWQSTIQLWKD